VITLGKKPTERIVVEVDGHRKVMIEAGSRLRGPVGCGDVAYAAARPAGRVWRVQRVG
jgi:hypothetical protein